MLKNYDKPDFVQMAHNPSTAANKIYLIMTPFRDDQRFKEIIPLY